VERDTEGGKDREDPVLRLRRLVRTTVPGDARVVAVGDAADVVRLEELPLVEPVAAGEIESRLPGLAEEGHEVLVLPDSDGALEELKRRLAGGYRPLGHESGVGAIYALDLDHGELERDLNLPPPEMRRLVSGLDDPISFLGRGVIAADSIRDAVGRAGADLRELGAILDFGCGCGRVIRHFRDLEPRLHGTDYNERLVAWCRRNLAFATFAENRIDSSLGYTDESFDLVYALSVLTHLDEPLQRRWISEFARVLRPGALLYVTLNGSGQTSLLEDGDRRRFESDEMIVLRPELAGGNMCLAFHPRPSLDRLFPSELELVEFIEQGARDSGQDVALFRRAA
jgi:SAM-dependent methyltransferase